jgi:hypothetical protein
MQRLVAAGITEQQLNQVSKNEKLNYIIAI